MNREEVAGKVRGWGVVKAFRFKSDFSEDGAWLVETRRGPEILDGWLYGSEIRVDFAARGFVVWTGRTVLAKKLAASNGLRLKRWDGECDLHIPASLADLILPQFGAKVRKNFSPEALEAGKARLAKYRQDLLKK